MNAKPIRATAIGPTRSASQPEIGEGANIPATCREMTIPTNCR